MFVIKLFYMIEVMWNIVMSYEIYIWLWLCEVYIIYNLYFRKWVLLNIFVIDESLK